LGCLNNYYPNPANLLACIEVPELNKIELCLVYDKNLKCLLCFESFYVNLDGKCQQTTTWIDNCLYYSNDGECELCRNGFKLDQF